MSYLHLLYIVFFLIFGSLLAEYLCGVTCFNEDSALGMRFVIVLFSRWPITSRIPRHIIIFVQSIR